MLNIPLKNYSATKKSHGASTTTPCFAHDMRVIDVEDYLQNYIKKETNLFSFDKCSDCLIPFVKSERINKSRDFLL